MKIKKSHGCCTKSSYSLIRSSVCIVTSDIYMAGLSGRKKKASIRVRSALSVIQTSRALRELKEILIIHETLCVKVIQFFLIFRRKAKIVSLCVMLSSAVHGVGGTGRSWASFLGAFVKQYRKPSVSFFIFFRLSPFICVLPARGSPEGFA